MILLDRAQVEELLDLDELLSALAAAHAELSSGAVSMPPRIAAFAQDGLLGAMPAYAPSAGIGAKLVTLYPGNTPPLPTHQAAIVLFDPDTGMATALMDATYITAMRTAGAAALAAKHLAREDARVLAVLGTGVQGRAAIEMFSRVRDFDEIRVAGRRTELTYEDAVRGAVIVAATTHSAEPVVMADWLGGGVHVSSVGYNTAGSELDPRIVARADVVCVESRDSALAPPPAGAVELAGADPGSVVELGELVTGSRPGRASNAAVTLYKSVGVAVQDLAAAALVVREARTRNVGLEFELEDVAG